MNFIVVIGGEIERGGVIVVIGFSVREVASGEGVYIFLKQASSKLLQHQSISII